MVLAPRARRGGTRTRRGVCSVPPVPPRTAAPAPSFQYQVHCVTLLQVCGDSQEILSQHGHSYSVNENSVLYLQPAAHRLVTGGTVSRCEWSECEDTRGVGSCYLCRVAEHGDYKNISDKEIFSFGVSVSTRSRTLGSDVNNNMQ